MTGVAIRIQVSTVYVFPCNDPPIARNTSNIALSKALPVPFNASDVDNPTDAVSAFIMAPPVAAGEIYFGGTKTVIIMSHIIHSA